MRLLLATVIVFTLFPVFGESVRDQLGPLELRFVSVHSECPFSMTDIEETARASFREFGIDPDAKAAVSLNMFFSSHKLESSTVVSSRIHLGVELPSGAVAYYESPTFGSMEIVGPEGISIEAFRSMTGVIVDKALAFSIDPGKSSSSTKPEIF